MRRSFLYVFLMLVCHSLSTAQISHSGTPQGFVHQLSKIEVPYEENSIIGNTTSGNIIDGVELGLVRILDQNDPEPVPVPLTNWSVVFMGLMVVVFFLTTRIKDTQLL